MAGRIADMSPSPSRPPQPQPTASDQEFQFLAVGMVAGAVPGIVVGLIIALSVGNPAMWVSITGGAGIIIGMVAASVIFRRRRARRNRDAARR